MPPLLLWFLIAVGLVALTYFGYRVWAKGQERSSRTRGTRKALEQHHETILVCVRCVGDDVDSVVRCLSTAVRNAASPLRIRFAIVQEDSPVDVYEALVQQLHQTDDGAGQNFSDKVKTLNLIEGEGFQQAFDNWRQIWDEEQYALVLDVGVELLQDWDVKLAEAMGQVPEHVALTSPGPNHFAALAAGPPYQKFWPVVVGRRFIFEPDKSVPSVAAHHRFTAFHGSQFAKVPKTKHYVPLYAADVAWSDHLFQHGTRFATVPGHLFNIWDDWDDGHLREQRPSRWKRQLYLSSAYCKFAGIKVKVEQHKEREDSSPDSSQGSDDEQGGGGGGGGGGKRRSKQPTVSLSYSLLPRAKVGITNFAHKFEEGDVKYGTKREIQRQLVLASREPR